MIQNQQYSRFRISARSVSIQMLALILFAENAATVFAANLPEGWLTDWKKATAQAKEQKKPILAVFSAAWCGPCQQMVHEVYPKPAVKEVLKDWVAVYIDEAQDRKTLEKFKIEAFPTFILLSSQAEEEDRVMGARAERDFVSLLKDHKRLTARLADLKAKLDKDEKNAALWKDLGDVYIQKDKADEAIKAYDKAASFDPEDKTGVAADVYFYHALPKKKTELEDSIKKLAEFEQKFPKSSLIAQAALYRAWMVADAGRTEEAINLLKDGIKKFPDTASGDQMKQTLEMLENEAKEEAKEKEKAHGESPKTNPDSPKAK